tara:strand:+ start:5288 stop:5467 length:180 start_codon:yes stop_codon:yes gene_type:complete
LENSVGKYFANIWKIKRFGFYQRNPSDLRNFIKKFSNLKAYFYRKIRKIRKYLKSQHFL